MTGAPLRSSPGVSQRPAVSGLVDERSGVDAKGVQSLAVVGHLRLIDRLDAGHPGLGRHGVHDRAAVLRALPSGRSG